MTDNRKFKRFPINLKATYLQEDDHNQWKECTVTDVSREGMGIELYLMERIPIRSVIHLEIHPPKRGKTIKAVGIITWVKKLKDNRTFNFIGGVELTTIKPSDKWLLLDYAYEDWLGKKGR
jgi:hypothetical protein